MTASEARVEKKLHAGLFLFIGSQIRKFLSADERGVKKVSLFFIFSLRKTL